MLSGTPSGKGLYLTVYPLSCPITDKVYPIGFSTYCIIHHNTPKPFPYNVILLASQTSKEGFCSGNELPREYHGQYLSYDGQTLVELNPLIIVHDVEQICIQLTLKGKCCPATPTSTTHAQGTPPGF